MISLIDINQYDKVYNIATKDDFFDGINQVPNGSTVDIWGHGFSQGITIGNPYSKEHIRGDETGVVDQSHDDSQFNFHTCNFMEPVVGGKGEDWRRLALEDWSEMLDDPTMTGYTGLTWYTWGNWFWGNGITYEGKYIEYDEGVISIYYR